MKKELKCVVRLEDNKPIIFMASPEDKSNVECFTFNDGHNETTVEYMRSLPLASDEIANKTLKEYENYLNSLPIPSTTVKKSKRLK